MDEYIASLEEKSKLRPKDYVARKIETFIFNIFKKVLAPTVDSRKKNYESTSIP